MEWQTGDIQRFAEDLNSSKEFLVAANDILEAETDAGKILNVQFFIKRIETHIYVLNPSATTL